MVRREFYLAETGDIADAIQRQEQACEHAFEVDADTQRENLVQLQAGRPIPFESDP